MAKKVVRQIGSARRKHVEGQNLSDDQMREELSALAEQLDEGVPIPPEDEQQEEPATVSESPAVEGPVEEATPVRVPERHDPYDVSKLGLASKYVVLSVLTFGDCAVQKDPDGIFDVLARNFESPGALSWWLNRVNHGDKIKYSKGKDMIEYIRKVAHELFRDLKGIGKPVPRW